MTVNAIEQLAYRAWDAFYLEMSHRQTAATNRGNFDTHRYHKAFMGIADLCHRYKVDVTDYITTCFMLTGKIARYILPSDFNNEEAMRAYRKRLHDEGDNVGLSWVTQVQELTQATFMLIPRVYGNEEDLLDAIDMPFHAWFRVLYPQQPSEKLVRHYGKNAWQQLQRDPLLLRFVKRDLADRLDRLETKYGVLVEGTAA